MFDLFKKLELKGAFCGIFAVPNQTENVSTWPPIISRSISF